MKDRKAPQARPTADPASETWNKLPLLKKSARPAPKSSSGLRARLQVDLVAKAFESAHEVLLKHLPIVFVKVVASQIVIGAAVAQQVVHDD